MQAPRTASVAKDFAGLRTNTGPVGRDPSSGEASELVNLAPLKRGELACRPGFRAVRFDAEELPADVFPAAPTVLSAVVEPGGASIVVTFSEACDAGSASAGFTVRATGGDLVGDNGDIAPGDPFTGQSAVTWDTNLRAVSAGETVTLEYDAATGDTASAATGVELAGFTGLPVTNNA